ncbi:hypothetical protein HH242_27475 (plasmid) [Escherichia coli O157:H7]|nr:hypothetical protein HH242_27475 [Escherichia coli O157:H7]
MTPVLPSKKFVLKMRLWGSLLPNDKCIFGDFQMSVCEMIELANRIVNGEQVKTPAIEAWIISEIIWWAHNRDNALV